jgi:hypothetical protein
LQHRSEDRRDFVGGGALGGEGEKVRNVHTVPTAGRPIAAIGAP